MKQDRDTTPLEKNGFGDQPDKGITNSFQKLSDSIVENVNVWLNVLDTDLNLVQWNTVAESISGYTRAEVVGHDRVWEWLYPDPAYCQAIKSQTTSLLKGERLLEYFETIITCKNGETRNISWNSCYLNDEQGKIFGAITFGYDITDLKRAEEALLKANREISALYQIASVASASFDLDTTLAKSIDCVLATINSDQGLIHLWDEEEERLRLVCHQGISNEIIRQIEQIPSARGLAGWIYTHKTPLTIPNLNQITDIPTPIIQGLNNSFVGVPMKVKGKVVGVFSVLGDSGRVFTPDEITLLASIADQVGVAVENTRLYHQAEQIAVMEERERLAYDLHDAVTQSLYSLTLLAEASRRLIYLGELPKAVDYITRLGDTALDALKEMRLLVYRLRPTSLEREGLVSAIQQRLGAVERRAGIKAHLLASDSIRLPQQIEEGLYRIIQEALNNTLKHSRANTVSVHIHADSDFVEVCVEDNGIGFEVDSINWNEGMGLSSIRERAKRLGGSFEIISSPGYGAKIIVRLNPKKYSSQPLEPDYELT